MEKLIDINSYPVSVVLKALLKDKTTGKNIIFATSAYTENGRTINEKRTYNRGNIERGLVLILFNRVWPSLWKNRLSEQEPRLKFLRHHGFAIK